MYCYRLQIKWEIKKNVVTEKFCCIFIEKQTLIPSKPIEVPGLGW
jgi:hypothetical protein